MCNKALWSCRGSRCEYNMLCRKGLCRGASKHLQPAQGRLKFPPTSSSDSLWGTEKQLVTSTECLSTVPVKEDCPCVIKSWAPKMSGYYPKAFRSLFKVNEQNTELISSKFSHVHQWNRILQRTKTLK